MYLLQPDINISLFRGGSWSTPPDESTGNSYYIGNDILDGYERANLFSVGEHYRNTTNVPEWVDGSYVSGDIVRYGTALFKCVADTSDAPNKNVSTPWLFIAYSNKYAMLSGTIEDRAYGYTAVEKEFQDWEMSFRTSASTIRYDDSSSGLGDAVADQRNSRLTSLAILNIFEVDEIQIVVKKSDNTTIVSDNTYNVSTYYTTGTVGWTSYLDSIKDNTTNGEVGSSLIVNLTGVINGYVTIYVRSAGVSKMRGIGGIFTGLTTQLGETNWGSTFDLTQFSTFTQDTFGTSGIVERGYKNNFTYDVIMDTEDIDRKKTVLSRNLAYPCVYIGDYDKDVTITYGIPSDIRAGLSFKKTFTSIEIKGF